VHALSPLMATTSYQLSGAILLAAGTGQLTPIKDTCLRHCRSPIGFLIQSWRPGRGGAFRMGLGAREILPWVLLVFDGIAVFRRHHEPVLDYRSGRVRPPGEDRADGLMDWTDLVNGIAAWGVPFDMPPRR